MIRAFLALALATGSASAGAFQNEMYPTAEEMAAVAKSAAADALAAAEAGDPVKQVLVASLYETGEGVPVNYPEALRWYRAAAAKNNAGAMNSLGKMYERGKGVSKDPVEALKWYLLASAREGVDTVIVTKNREAVSRLLTKEQVAEARQRASQWRPGTAETKSLR